MIYYIYLYLDKFNIPFYVGKGKKDRYKIVYHVYSNCSDNNLLKNKINKLGIKNIKIAFLHQNLSEDQAFLYEKVWIKLIGRRDLGLGPLCNLTDGGEGSSGTICLDATRKKISLLRRGVSNSKNWHHTKESKEKISQSNKNHIVSEETRKKISIQKRDYKKTEEQKNLFKKTLSLNWRKNNPFRKFCTKKKKIK